MATVIKKQEDARVVKTRARLFSAFSALLSEKPFEEITINEICDKAGVRRATFYKHFRDKYDFLAVLTESMVQQFESDYTTVGACGAEYHVKFVRELIHYILDNESAIKLIIKSNMQTTLIDIIINQIHRNSYEWLNIAEKNGKKLVASTETVSTMLAGGIGTIIIKWFTGDRTISPSELSDEIEKVIRAMFAE